MEKSKSFPEYSSSYTNGFGYNNKDDQPAARSYAFNGPTIASDDGDMKRKKRIAEYNMFTTGTKLKSAVRDSFKWIKNKFTDVRYGI
ncbi:mediator of RNA polymerase II transcription subunit 8 [Tanacetum coccineum]